MAIRSEFRTSACPGLSLDQQFAPLLLAGRRSVLPTMVLLRVAGFICNEGTVPWDSLPNLKYIPFTPRFLLVRFCLDI